MRLRKKEKEDSKEFYHIVIGRNGHHMVVNLDFPYWIRFAHFINIIFITLLIRSGIEILSALPKMYFNDHARPGTEWIKFTKKKMPQDRLWISLEEEESFPSLVALPGHKNLGLGRHWHFFLSFFG